MYNMGGAKSHDLSCLHRPFTIVLYIAIACGIGQNLSKLSIRTYRRKQAYSTSTAAIFSLKTSSACVELMVFM